MILLSHLLPGLAWLGRTRNDVCAWRKVLALALWVLLSGWGASGVLSPIWAQGVGGASILQPSQAVNPEYRFAIDAVDPSAATNPKGAEIPGFRAENQMMIYTPAFGNRTGTNEAGLEVVVRGGQVVTVQPGDSEIPRDGFVVSAHGAASQWLSRFGKVGAELGLNDLQTQVVVRLTPAVYLNQVDDAIRRAQARVPVSEAAYTQAFGQAQSCRAQLASLSVPGTVSPEMVSLAESCQQAANRAFYNTIPVQANEFRGVWLRPDSLDPARVQAVLSTLKQAHIQHVFLETYFQGKTAYPSQVMADYGLPEQHAQFRGGDPVRLWIEQAHQQGLKVHVWAQVFFAGNQRESLEQYGPILNKYPQWRNVERAHWNDVNPVISDVEPGHYFLDPANPEVQQFLEKLLLEMVTRYDADGLNLDYIRYPASAAVNKPYYLGTTWGYTEAGRSQFKAMIEQERQATWQKQQQAALKSPKGMASRGGKLSPLMPSADPKDLTLKDPLWPRWVAWRKDQVTRLVKTVNEKAHAVKPNLLISAVVFPSSEPTYAQKLQDYPRWAEDGLIQALTPIGLSTLPERMRAQCLKLKQQVHEKVPVYVGIFGLYNRQEPVELLKQIEVVHQAQMQGVVLFDGSRLTPAYQEALQEGPFRE